MDIESSPNVINKNIISLPDSLKELSINGYTYKFKDT